MNPIEDFNPFAVNVYEGPEFFCDREDETSRIISHAQSGLSSTLFSIRRMGKTSLLYHVLHKVNRQKKMTGIYMDIYATQNLKDFVQQLSSAALKSFPEKKPLGKQIWQLIKSLRPVLSYDTMDGTPQVSFDFSQAKQYEKTLESILLFLEKQKQPILLIIDEFQQITEYPEKNVEALMRTYMQRLHYLRFIFSGSSKHLMNEIFNSAKRPFFASTKAIHLAEIDEEVYKHFIQDVFKKFKRTVTPDALSYITGFTRRHTFYTQSFCQYIFNSQAIKIDLSLTQRLAAQLLKEQEPVFYQYRNLLTHLQWQLLTAIAKEGKVYQPTSKKFLHKHPVGTPANISRTLQAMLNTEMIYIEHDEQGDYYAVYDCFLSRWLSKEMYQP